MEVKLKCPKCNGPVVPMEDKLYRCDRCRMLTDCQEDGDIGYGNQERYAERKEAFQARQRDRLNNRFSDRRRR